MSKLLLEHMITDVRSAKAIIPILAAKHSQIIVDTNLWKHLYITTTEPDPWLTYDRGVGLRYKDVKICHPTDYAPGLTNIYL